MDADSEFSLNLPDPNDRKLKDTKMLICVDDRSMYEGGACDDEDIEYIQQQLLAFLASARLRPWTLLLSSQMPYGDVGLEIVTGHPPLFFSVDTAPSGKFAGSACEDLLRIHNSAGACLLDVVDTAVFRDCLVKVLVAITDLKEDAENIVLSALAHIYRTGEGDGNHTIIRLAVPNAEFIFALRDAVLDSRFEKMLNAFLASAGQPAADWRIHRDVFIAQYKSMLAQLDALTLHQRQKVRACQEAERSADGVKRLHTVGPAGSGKTFVGMHLSLEFLEPFARPLRGRKHKQPEDHTCYNADCGPKCKGILLFIALNEALVAFFVNWLARRMQQGGATKRMVAKVLHEHVRVLFSPMGDGTLMRPVFSKGSGNLEAFEPVPVPDEFPPAFVMVDEAHHSLGPLQAGRSNTDGATHASEQRIVTEQCAAATHLLMLVSDYSQGTTKDDSAPEWAKGCTVIQLTEVVRNSKRIFDASTAFLRDGRGNAGITCMHDVAGPRLTPLLFACTDDEAPARYARELASALVSISESYPGMSLHDQIVILLPEELRQQIIVEHQDGKLPLLQEQLATHTHLAKHALTIVTASEAARAQSFQSETTSTSTQPGATITVDTVEKFDGNERPIVIACGLDEARSLNAVSKLYRAITRGHMDARVVQRFVPDGWLAYLSAVDCDEDQGFDQEAELALKHDTKDMIEGRTTDPAPLPEPAAALQNNTNDQQASYDAGGGGDKPHVDTSEATASSTGSNAGDAAGATKEQSVAAPAKVVLRIMQNTWHSNQTELAASTAEDFFNPYKSGAGGESADGVPANKIGTVPLVPWHMCVYIYRRLNPQFLFYTGVSSSQSFSSSQML